MYNWKNQIESMGTNYLPITTPKTKTELNDLLRQLERIIKSKTETEKHETNSKQ